MTQRQVPDEQHISHRVALAVTQPEFRYFLASCIDKWDEIQPEQRLINIIMESVCQTWDITPEQLLNDRKHVEPRSFFFFVIHKKVNLSYETIGNMFDRVKGNVHSGAKNIEFMLENRQQKHLVEAFVAIESAVLVTNG